MPTVPLKGSYPFKPSYGIKVLISGSIISEGDSLKGRLKGCWRLREIIGYVVIHPTPHVIHGSVQSGLTLPSIYTPCCSLIKVTLKTINININKSSLSTTPPQLLINCHLLSLPPKNPHPSQGDWCSNLVQTSERTVSPLSRGPFPPLCCSTLCDSQHLLITYQVHPVPVSHRPRYQTEHPEPRRNSSVRPYVTVRRETLYHPISSVCALATVSDNVQVIFIDCEDMCPVNKLD